MSERIVFCWSGGKDSALALHRMLHNDRYTNRLPSYYREPTIRIDVTVGEKVYRRVEQTTPDGAKGFRFCDLLPAKGQDDGGGVPKVEWQ